MRQIRQLRKQKKMTQFELAQSARIGIASLQNIESGKANPSLETLEKLLSALGYQLAITKMSSKSFQWTDLGLPLMDEQTLAPPKSGPQLRQEIQNLRVQHLASLKDHRTKMAVAAFFSALKDHFPSIYSSLDLEFRTELEVHFFRNIPLKLRRISIAWLAENF